MSANQWFDVRTKCPGCDNPEFDLLISMPYSNPVIRDYLTAFYARQGLIELSYLEDVDFVLARCPTCALIFQVHIPGDALMKKLYDEWIDPVKVYDLIDGRRDIKFFLGYSKQIANIISHLGGKPQNLTFLDFGMGWGHWCKLASAYDCSVMGYELSVARIQHARNEGICVMDFEEITQTKFDYINTDQVFEHIPEPLETLRYLKKSLKPNGIIRVCVPNSFGVERKIELFSKGKLDLEKINQIAPLEHINSFTYKSILAMGAQVGLSEKNVMQKYITSLRDFVYEKFARPYLRRTGKGNTDVYLAIGCS